jgi:hypothetical protein
MVGEIGYVLQREPQEKKVQMTICPRCFKEIVDGEGHQCE